MHYKDTIFLPITTFAMRINLPSLEKDILDYWDKIHIYNLIKNKKTTKKFYFHYGPPFTNNNFHLGHGLNITLKDIISRFFVMMDYEVPILFGHDCHGYPIECEVQKLLTSEKNTNYSVKEFRSMCRKYAYTWSQIHKKQTKQLGVLTGDLPPSYDFNPENPLQDNHAFYATMNKDTELKTYEIFSNLILNNKVYRGMKPIMWSIHEQSSLAEVDVIYKNKKSTSVYVKLKIIETTSEHLRNNYIIFWTTTPWTIISNLAVAFHKDIIYTYIYINGVKHFIAKNLEMDLMQKLDIFYDVQEGEVAEIKGDIFQNTFVEHPFIEDKYVPMLHSDHVSDKDGTGFVHVAPDHGEEDFILGQKYQLNLCNFVGGNGYFAPHTPLLSGLHIFKDEHTILDMLSNKLVHQEEIEHSYPFSDRSNMPLIYICTEQIFINLQNEKKKLLETIEQIKWFPDTGKNRIISFVKNRNDWCVSRQRVWGVPLLVFVHKETGEILKNTIVQDLILQEIKKNGTDHLFEIDWCIFLPEDLKNIYRPVYGILDCWFDSGCTYDTVMHTYFDVYQSDLVLEGSDQHRGWFQSSLCVNIANNTKVPPYKAVVTHGFLVDEKGHKISKSKKNGLPFEVCLSYGIDIIRIWVATCNYYDDIKIGEKIFADKVDIYRKIRNILRYLIGATYMMKEEELQYTFQPDDYLELYILHKMYLLQNFIVDTMHQYEIKNTFDEIFKFIQDLSLFYLDIKKDILYCDDQNKSNKRKATRKTQHILLEFLLRILAPIIPFTVEEVALNLNRDTYHTKSLLLFSNSLGNENIYVHINILREVMKSVKIELEKAKQNNIIHTINEAIVEMSLPENINYFSEEFLAEILMVSKVIKNTAIITIYKTNIEKCLRCWRYMGNLCNRCTQVLN